MKIILFKYRLYDNNCYAVMMLLSVSYDKIRVTVFVDKES